MKISFFGATGTVTGSKHLVQAAGRRVLIDCGLFQGFKQLRLRNWAPPPFDPTTLDAVVLTHAHIDHSGYLPLLARYGFRGKVYSSHASRDLCGILLPDAAHLQEEEAFYANKHQLSKHKKALPLFDSHDAKAALKLMQGVAFGQDINLGQDLSFRLVPNGHMLGSACVVLKSGGRTAVFSGDLGRPNDPILHPPEPISHADILVLESTYGNRLHPQVDPEQALAEIINRTVQRAGVVVIPAFAVGRAQTLLYHLHQLKERRAIPDVPVYLNSPMALDATRLYANHLQDHKLSKAQYQAMCRGAIAINTPEESQALNRRKGPMIIISASGMATGGRVLHHIKQFGPDPRNTLLFAGFQAGGTRGETITSGADCVKIHGEYVPIKAEVQKLDVFSSHADYAETLEWLRNFKVPPAQTCLVHGEPAAADALRLHIQETLGWTCHVPDYLETLALS
ncbi:MAG: MBL fold metallo-hydrolase [Burkholderiaceae bacterium]